MKHLKQTKDNTTLMGCLRGAVDYYGLPYSQAMLYALTGHGFLINIHRELCPSGPYIWDHAPFYKALATLGIAAEHSPFYSGAPSLLDIKKEDRRITAALNAGEVMMMTGLEHQLIDRYDEDYLYLHLPWDCDGIPTQVSRLNRKDWNETLRGNGFVQFTRFIPGDVPPDLSPLIRDVPRRAVSCLREPDRYKSSEDYRIGLGAYELWIEAVRNDRADDHGNWWNGTVWAECRKMAAQFFREAARGDFETGWNPDDLSALSEIYDNISGRLDEAKEQRLDKGKKIIILSEALELEEEAIAVLEPLAGN